ncbi:ATP-dependent DNA helicase [Frankliniella fusca]|uniref:ATP-dependent DNA helicase n=1 Tax=Frankliniella fusca TaxID=407009 RepID=A0AAE1HVT9_9NEOP|nr:ATP-dependent DNA helicase [Frankliniella fusca]
MPNIKANKIHKANIRTQIRKKYHLKWTDTVKRQKEMTERSRQQQYKLSISHAQNYVSRKRELALENDRRFILNNQQKQYDPIAEEIARKKWLKCQKEYELAIRQYHSHVSPHVHMLLWIENAPLYDPSNKMSKKAVCNFVDQIISTYTNQVDNNLADLQFHRHTHTCYKKHNQKQCRFGIPFFPMRKTRILKPLSIKSSKRNKKVFKRILKKIDKVKNKSSSLELTYSQFLKKIGINHNIYIKAIRSTLKKAQLFLQRHPCDMFVSPFSPKILQLMRSNVNIQFVFDAYGAACYIIDYINKSDRGVSNLLREPRIIRYRNYNYELDPENYIREQLMLFHPWKNETRDLKQTRNNINFRRHSSSIAAIRKKFNAFNDNELNKAITEANERDENNISLFDKEAPTFDFDTYHLNDPFVRSNIELECENALKSSEYKTMAPTKLPESEFQNLFETLNQDQRDFIMHVAEHFRTSQDQRLFFLTGGAGVGKSLVIKTLYQTLYRIFNSQEDTNPDIPKVLLCAPTGKAAFNIKGQTLHHAFHLPLNQKQLTPLSPNVSQSLATALGYLKLLIIDEISMVGQHILQMVHERLQHIMGNKKDFGGVSVLAVGDFYQLRPVFARPLYSPTTGNTYQDIFQKPLWHKFKVFELTKIMRQNEANFQHALNNLAKGKLKTKDIDLFQSRTFVKIPPQKHIQDGIHLFAKNKDVDNFNAKALNNIRGKLYNSVASDVIHGTGTKLARRQLLHSLEHSKPQDTMGIPTNVSLKVNAKYMISYNVDTNDGICNGATGTLKQIDFGKNLQGQKKTFKTLKIEGLKVIFHNVQSLPKHINLIRNDKNFTSTDVMIFGETWVTSRDYLIINDFKLLIHTPHETNRRPQGVAIYIKEHLMPHVTNLHSEIFVNSKYKIDVAYFTIFNYTIIGLYAKPHTPLSLWEEFFTYTQALKKHHIFIVGDFNINSLDKKKFAPFTRLLSSIQVSLLNKGMNTSMAGKAIDWILCDTKCTVGKYASFFSFHDPIWACKQIISMQTRRVVQDYKKLAGVTTKSKMAEQHEIEEKQNTEEDQVIDISSTDENFEDFESILASIKKEPSSEDNESNAPLATRLSNPKSTPTKRKKKTKSERKSNLQDSSKNKQKEDKTKPEMKMRKQIKPKIKKYISSSSSDSDSSNESNKYGSNLKKKARPCDSPKPSTSRQLTETEKMLLTKSRTKNESSSTKILPKSESESDSDTSSSLESDDNKKRAHKKKYLKHKRQTSTSDSNESSTNDSDTDSSTSSITNKKKISSKQRGSNSTKRATSTEDFFSNLNETTTKTSRNLRPGVPYKLLKLTVSKEIGFNGVPYKKAVAKFKHPKKEKTILINLPGTIAKYSKKTLKEMKKRIDRGQHPNYTIKRITTKKKPVGKGTYDLVEFEWS